MSQKKIVLVGGGTGGHFYPLIAIAEALHDSDSSINLHYFGPRKFDANALKDAGISFTYVSAGKRRRYFSPLNALSPFITFFGFLIAFFQLYITYPDVVVSKGGYTSVPVVFAAFFLRIPVIVHESDSKVGGANKLAVRFARECIVAYDESLEVISNINEHVHKLGIPIRKQLKVAPTPNAVEELGIKQDRPLILVIGGSQGAERLNEFIIQALNELLPDYSVMHQIGEKNFEKVTSTVDNLIVDADLRAHYHPLPFLNQTTLNNAYTLSQIIITRAGSTALFEIAQHGKPSIVIPIPETISHDQRSNAYAYGRTGAAIVIEEENMGDNLLKAEIDRIMNDDSIYESMSAAAQAFAKPEAAQQTANLILQVAQEHD